MCIGVLAYVNLGQLQEDSRDVFQSSAHCCQQTKLPAHHGKVRDGCRQQTEILVHCRTCLKAVPMNNIFEDDEEGNERVVQKVP